MGTSTLWRLAGLAAVALIIVGAAPEASASHFRFGKTECTPTGTAGEVSCEVTVGYRRSYFGAPNAGDPVNIDATFYWGDGTTEPFIVQVTSASPAQDLFIGTATYTHTYASSGDYNVGFASCCRIFGLANRSSEDYQVFTVLEVDAAQSATIDPTPITSVAPVTGFPKSTSAGTPETIQIPINDPNNESIECRLSTDAEAGGGAAPTGLTVDDDCSINWDNSALPDGLYTLQVIIEEVDAPGQPAGNATAVDFILDLGADTGVAPSCSFSVSTPLAVPVGAAVMFDVTAEDADAGDTVELSGVTVPGWGAMSPALPLSGSSPQTSTFSGTAPATAGTFFATYTVTDAAGNVGQCGLTINVEVISTGPLACTPQAPLSFTSFDIDAVGDPRGEFAELTNSSDDDEVDLADCDFIVFDPFTEDVTYAADAAGTMASNGTHAWANSGGHQPLPMNSFVDTPGGAFALIQGSAQVGDDVLDVLASSSVVAAVVYLDDESTYGSVGGGDAASNAAALVAALEALAGATSESPSGEAADLSVVPVPNPLSARGAVRFGLAEAADVNVALYDALGRQVAVLAQGPYGPGRHEAHLDAAALPTGVYVVRVVAGGDVQTARLTVSR